MGYYLSNDEFNQVISELSSEYRIFAPKLSKNRGRGGKKEVIRYGEIKSVSEIVYDKKSDYSPKEVVYPIMQTLLYFSDSDVVESELKDERGIIIILRPCDIHGIGRLDQMMLGNGGQADFYYERLRSKVKFVMMECRESFETCFCVSMGTNKADDYAASIRFEADGVKMEVKDDVLETVISQASSETVTFEPEFVTENVKKVQIPDITDRSMIKDIIAMDYWKQFNDRCIGCGGCNTVCMTCSCFDTTDVIYDETSMDGERRRVWSSCMLDTYTTMAGGHGVRSQAADKMRFKTLHKIYDYKLRFGKENMCVGCGRCDMQCPKDIKFSDTINGLAAEVEKLKAGKEA